MRTNALLFAACGIAVSASFANAQLTNPSFEIPGTTTVFDAWTTFENAVPEFATARTGSVSLKAYGNGGGAYNAAGAFQDRPVTPGQGYEAAAWSFHSSADPMQGSNFSVVNIEWLNAGGGQISFISGAATDAADPTDTWSRATVAGIAPTGAVTARVVVLHIQGPELLPGAVLFDDVSFATTTITGLQNPGFENDFQGWTSFNNAFIANDFAHTGTKSAKMFGCFCSPYNATGCFQDFPAQPGENWQGKAWVATRANDRISGANFAVLNIEFRDAGNNIITFVSQFAADATTTPDQWSQVVVSGIAPPGTVLARLVPLHIQPEFAGGAVWWDDTEFGIAEAPGCPADFNNDGGVDGDDVIAFFAEWDAGNADYDGANGTDGDDVIAFFADWDTQCTG
ncbi:MAG: hypothetical protein ACOYN0_07560 [Phycisphaerales bacterium]